MSWWRASDRRRLFDSRTDWASVRALPWERFEHLIGEAYRRQGYRVQENASTGADGGVDLVLAKDGETVLVQCKRWDKPVGVPVVRELFGAVTAAGATRRILVAASRFTKPAEAFAWPNGIGLVDGRSLERLIGSVSATSGTPTTGSGTTDSSAPSAMSDVPAEARPAETVVSCPLCEAPMTP